MPDRLLHRREFLRLSLVMTGSVLATACQAQRIVPTATKGIMSTPELKTGIQLKGTDADVWTFTKSVKGSMENPAACQTVLIDNNGARVHADLQEYFFSAEVPIRSGANPIKAICIHPDNEEEMSPSITINGRLGQRPTASIAPSLAQGLIIFDGSGSLPDEVENQPIREYIWSARSNNPAIVKVQTDPNQEQENFHGEIHAVRIEVELPEANGEYYFSLRVIDEAGREDSGTTYVVVEKGEPRIPDYDHENPVWVEEAIVYGVIPRLL